ncbi:uncharacterized protein LOC133389277 [Rhineura floridana]|uniref:uncharacterized protein LOC133389277 n=1 Tax=Rhineura floridana TaxID=261503 RepID=UPI002AC84687|nr:uncharacterized protein LOC133389277 [Rhineura floridana]XP_061492602.1 uncharacterized protein LOC133389277 [Rhineura floridana]XP_061492603.1 uncharacterized protein LOC133389277 [Rhineura floridana]
MTIKKVVEIMDVQEGTFSLDMFQKIMNEIKLTKQELRHNRQVISEFGEMRQELKEIQDSMRKENKDKFGKLKKDERKIKGKVQALEIGLNMVLGKDLDFLAVMDPGDKYYCLEFSAVPEGIGEEIGDKDIIGSKKFMDWKDLMELEMEKVYRINSCFVTMKNPSRDVLVHSVKKRNRDAVLQQYFSDTFGNDGKKIFVMKEIPIRLLLYDYDSKIIGCVKMEDGRWNQHG